MISLAIVGLGYWGPNLLRVFDSLRDCSVKYCWDLDPLVRASYSKQYPHIKFCSHFDTILEDPGLDAVIVATPVSTHYVLARQIISSDKHVFVEKPLTLELDHAIDLTELAEKRKVTFRKSLVNVSL